MFYFEKSDLYYFDRLAEIWDCNFSEEQEKNNMAKLWSFPFYYIKVNCKNDNFIQADHLELH